MKLTFLGTGGARYSMIEQLRKTGGLYLEMDDLNVYIDPGPGALLNSLEEGIDLAKIDVLVVSHAHLDHYNDAEVLIEAMTDGCTEERGTFISNRTVLEGNEENPCGVISEYHKEPLDEIVIMEDGDSYEKNGHTFESIETQHRDEKPICFKIGNPGGEEIGFLTDSTYLEKLGEFFESTDYLIINCVRPKEKSWEGHLNVKDVKKIIDRADPEVAILTHFGRYMIFQSIPEQEKWLQENVETDTRVMFAEDFQKIDFDSGERGLEKFIQKHEQE